MRLIILPQIVTTTCNQCDQHDHSRCPAESLARSGFIENAGDHCQCAYDGHKTPQTKKEAPRIKSMLGAQKEERDVTVDKVVKIESDDD